MECVILRYSELNFELNLKPSSLIGRKIDWTQS